MGKLKSAFPYALGAVFVSIALLLCLFLTNVPFESPLKFVYYIGYIVFTILGLKAWREKENGGFMSYGQAMGYSMWVAMFFSVVITIWTYIFIMYIGHDSFMDFISRTLDQNARMMKDQYHMSDEQIEQSMKLTKRFLNPGFMTITTLLASMFFLTIINLIISAFMKKDNDSFTAPQNPRF